MASARLIQVFNELTSQGRRTCRNCNAPVDDVNNYKARYERQHATNLMMMIVEHLTCPE